MSVLIRCFHAARYARVPGIVVTEHAHQHFAENFKLKRRSQKFAPRADAVTVIHSELARFFVNDLGVAEERLHLIPNGVDIDKYQSGQPPEAIADRIRQLGGEIVIGCVSRFHHDKDIHNLVRAFKIVTTTMSRHCTLVIVGDGPEMAEVRALAAELDLTDRILFAGVQNNIPDWLRAFDIFALPSRREGMPLVLLEALSAGLPVVATRTGGVPDIIDNTVGKMVEPENPQELAAALIELIQDNSRRRAMAEATRRKAELNYSFNTMVDRYLEVFQQLQA